MFSLSVADRISVSVPTNSTASFLCVGRVWISGHRNANTRRTHSQRGIIKRGFSSLSSMPDVSAGTAPWEVRADERGGGGCSASSWLLEGLWRTDASGGGGGGGRGQAPPGQGGGVRSRSGHPLPSARRRGPPPSTSVSSRRLPCPPSFLPRATSRARVSGSVSRTRILAWIPASETETDWLRAVTGLWFERSRQRESPLNQVSQQGLGRTRGRGHRPESQASRIAGATDCVDCV